jgi:hypothetical protein
MYFDWRFELENFDKEVDCKVRYLIACDKEFKPLAMFKIAKWIANYKGDELTWSVEFCSRVHNLASLAQYVKFTDRDGVIKQSWCIQKCYKQEFDDCFNNRELIYEKSVEPLMISIDAAISGLSNKYQVSEDRIEIVISGQRRHHDERE